MQCCCHGERAWRVFSRGRGPAVELLSSLQAEPRRQRAFPISTATVRLRHTPDTIPLGARHPGRAADAVFADGMEEGVSLLPRLAGATCGVAGQLDSALVTFRAHSLSGDVAL